MKEVRLVTINTDASYHPEHKVGGYAYWISSDLGTFKGSGPLYNLKGQGPSDCEDMAICKALHFLNTLKDVSIDKIHINTDSMISIRRIKTKDERHIAIPYILTYINNLKPKERPRFSGKNAFVNLKHVKAHTHTKTPRNWVNDWCDKQAKIEMRKQIK